MKKHIFILFISFWCFNISFSQAQQLIKSTEYLRDEEKRRDIYLNADMQIVKEDYYGEKTWSYNYKKYVQQIIFSFEYTSEKKIGKINGYDEKGRLFEIDYINGSYKDFQKDIVLKFTGDFIFDGIQKGEKIVVNYKDGVKDGMIIQADSGIIIAKGAAAQNIAPRNLRFDIKKMYTEYSSMIRKSAIDYEPIYSFYRGLLLTFKNGHLDGPQLTIKSEPFAQSTSRFINGRLIDYTSYDKGNAIISKLETDSGITNKPQILNGQLLSTDNQYIFWHHSLEEVGDIVKVIEDFNPQNYTGYGNFLQEIVPTFFETKKAFDDAKVKVTNEKEMRAIFDIPMFYIQRFEFNNKEEENIIKLKIGNGKNKIKALNEFKGDTLKLANNYFLTESPFSYYEYSSIHYHEFLLIPHDGGDKRNPRDKEEETRLLALNQKLVKWLGYAYNYSPPNFYIMDEEAHYINNESIKSFLSNFIAKIQDNILELENKTFQFKDPFNNDSEFYSYRSLTVEKYTDNLIIPKQNSKDKITLYDKHKVDVLVNGKQYCFVFDKNNTGKFRVSEVKVLDASNGTLIYEYRT